MPFKVADSDYSAFSQLWRKQVSKYPDNPDVVWNAAWFFRRLDDEFYEELLRRGRVLEPEKDRWSSALTEQEKRNAASKP